jgi:hypothetical protein
MIIGDAHDQPAFALHQVLHRRRAFSFVMPGQSGLSCADYADKYTESAPDYYVRP